MSSHFILGTVGWEWPEWADSFYPSDMPNEWRLTYFNTQFECVYLPAPAWRGADAADLEAWAAETHDRFIFLLEGAAVEELPPALAGRVEAVLADDPRLIRFDRGTDLKSLAKRLARVDTESPHYLISTDADLGQIERVRTLLVLMGL